jgi:hypothetical protein
LAGGPLRPKNVDGPIKLYELKQGREPITISAARKPAWWCKTAVRMRDPDQTICIAPALCLARANEHLGALDERGSQFEMQGTFF